MQTILIINPTNKKKLIYSAYPTIFFCRLMLIGILVLAATKEACSQENEAFRDTALPVATRVFDLLNRLTVEEKISLLTETAPAIPRLGIDKYFHGNEALHGVVRPGKFTVFPQAIALASTWNPDLMHKVATAISDEARGKWNEFEQGRLQKAQYSDLLAFWSPTINMARDPRWGRTPETYGEDPFLTSRMAIPFIKGLQGSHPRYVKVISTPKHFAANNEDHNRFWCNAIISERALREYYLPHFEMCVREASPQAFMTAYNAINGIPATVNRNLITTILRKEWGFNGYTVSDCGAPEFLVIYHKYVKTYEEAAAASIKAGLDLECGYKVYTSPLKNAYASGVVNKREIDSAAFRVLRARVLLGLFDNPADNPYNKISPSVIGSGEHKELALEAARQSLVLLKNENAFLPFKKNTFKSIAVLGINAAEHVYGDYSGTPVNKPVSVLEGLQHLLGDSVKINYVPWVTRPDGFELIQPAFFPHALEAEYFSNKNLEGTGEKRQDAQINFNPENQAPDPFLPKSPLSIRWKGVLKPTITGTYTIALTTDDGCRLYLNDELYINSWSNRPALTDSFQIDLVAGRSYQLKVEYFDDGGGKSALLKWRLPGTKETDYDSLFRESIKAAKESDAVVAVLGINKNIEREGQDRKTIELPEDQEVFIKKILAANRQTAVVLVAGSSLAINWINQQVPAVLNAWYPGEQGGTAVAEALFGKYNPGGRLPLTYYQSLADLPAFDDYEVQKGRTYQYFKGKPLYPFGYGLSYTAFTYDKPVVKQSADSLFVSFSLQNNGKMAGDEVAQVYLQFPAMKRVVPIKQLYGFRRVSLGEGETQAVNIAIAKQHIRLWDDRKKRYVRPMGEYKVLVGASSEDIRLRSVIKMM